ncbi:hypothetical protein IOD16_18325 [Saccharothrix sp. 6-C]|uniref:hypothetical protein n=1 Tax=Saccharothrix sp. 6-C TaxID=2781735 RepID=UPI0019174C5A|nr:hypothetical protein [Saccharothrix sp. 6-C]QQQ80166.1 hypothetical protein IOD16_18325 [Saccharothrix sp. 6-C]
MPGRTEDLLFLLEYRPGPHRYVKPGLIAVHQATEALSAPAAAADDGPAQPPPTSR